jgi:hypothetical protein
MRSDLSLTPSGYRASGHDAHQANQRGPLPTGNLGLANGRLKARKEALDKSEMFAILRLCFTRSTGKQIETLPE